MKPYFEDGGVRLYHGCGVDFMRSLSAGSVPVIWTDPPYGHGNQNGDLQSARVGVKGARMNDAVAIKNDLPEDYEPLMRSFLSEAGRVMRPDRCCCCCCCCGGGGPSPTFARLSLWIDEYLSFFHAVVWDKTARGHGMGWRFRRDYEMVLVSHRKTASLSWRENAEPLSNILRCKPPKNVFHPTTKPTELVGLFLSRVAHEGDLVLDPFAGSGTTLLAARSLGLPAIGVEIDEAHCESAAKRLSQMVLSL